jgi:hypothetical protein
VAVLPRRPNFRAASGFPALTGRQCHGTLNRLLRELRDMVGIGRMAAVALGIAFCVTSVSQPRAASWLEMNFWLSGPNYERDERHVPACDFPGALDRIIANFHTKEYRFWNSQLRIVGVENIHETAWLPWAAQSIPRRYCSGTAVINDGARHPLFYSIAEDTDIDGFGWGINFCVDGLDRNDAYNPNCRSAKP